MARTARSLLLVALVAIASVLVTGAAAAAGPAPRAAPAPGPDRQAGGLECVTGEGEVATSAVLVVVVFPSGTFTRCVPPGGSGLDVLRASGLAVEASSFGSLGSGVCGITDPEGTFVGCADGPDCFVCPASSGGSRYWGYFRCYAYSQVGGGSTRPAGGTVEGWRYGGGGGWSGARPAECDDGIDETTPPPASTTTRPPTPTPTDPGGGGGGGSARPVDGGGTTPGGGPVDDPARPGTSGSTGPEGPSTTDGGATTDPAAAADTDTDTDNDTDADADADERDRAGDGEEEAAGRWTPAEGGGSRPAGTVVDRSDDGGGVPVGALAGAGGAVGLLAALAVRTRRARAAEPADGPAEG